VPLIVISDSSPIRALHHLGLLSLCHELYGTVIIPRTVQVELRRSTTTCPALEIADYPHFQIHVAQAHPLSLGIPTDLDAGETEAIAIAIELHADLLLMDERKGTDSARHLGLPTIGVLGVLLEAKRQSRIAQVMPLVDRLVFDLKFFVSAALRQKIAQLAGE